MRSPAAGCYKWAHVVSEGERSRTAGGPWHPWGPEAFDRASKEDKLVFLYLSATWSQWCRELDASVFDDPDILQRLRENYVPVRVDADERPDLSSRYNMGGWPSFAFVTPQGDLVWGATSLTRDQLYRLLDRFHQAYRDHRGRIMEEVRRREEKIREIVEETVHGRVSLDEEIFRKTVQGVMAGFDPVYGGFGRAPKFPLPDALDVIGHAYWKTLGGDFEFVLRRTLEGMAEGGLFDAVEGGFHRYAIKESWASPQREKLCADNARLIRCYLNGGRLLHEGEFIMIAKKTAEWALHSLWDNVRGLFRGSQAADELYYTLGLQERLRRSPPPTDPSAYTFSNARMISALVHAWAQLGLDSLLATARRCMESVLRWCRAGDEIAHALSDPPGVPGLLADAVALGDALLDLYEATGEPAWLREAERIAEYADSRFRGPDGGLVDRLPRKEDVGTLSLPRKELDENGDAALLFIRLSDHLGNPRWRERARGILSSFPNYHGQYGPLTARYAIAVERLLEPPLEIEVHGRPPELIREAVALPTLMKVIRHPRPGEPGAGAEPGLVLRLNGRSFPPVRTTEELRHRAESLA